MEEIDNRSRTGAPTSLALPDSGLSTIASIPLLNVAYFNIDE
jgi:hypothetical protein